ncbi:DUF3310 domain-containing protein [Streptomyces sp. NPDC004682]
MTLYATYRVGDQVRILRGQLKGQRGVIKTREAPYTAPFAYGVQVVHEGRTKILAFGHDELEPWANVKPDDAVNSPSHYTWLPNGLEVIDLTEHLMNNRGNVVKYVCRAGRKNPATEMQDLEKALWYLQREIKRVKRMEKSSG